MNRADFLAAYRRHLTDTYAWAQDAAKLEKFMRAVVDTLDGKTNEWHHDGPSVRKAWIEVGGKPNVRPTLTALRKLS